eukprot:m.75900 g.75900  ORF g.75900 m.75900 type:complete len:369 (+) comp12528_c0_seq1:174-1280(+)
MCCFFFYPRFFLMKMVMTSFFLILTLLSTTMHASRRSLNSCKLPFEVYGYHKRNLMLLTAPCNSITTASGVPNTSIGVCIAPKSGTTSFLSWVRNDGRKHQNLHKAMGWRNQTMPWRLSKDFVGISHPAHKQTEMIVVLRHPLERFISAFRSKVFCGPEKTFDTYPSGPEQVKRTVNKQALNLTIYQHRLCLKFREYVHVVKYAVQSNQLKMLDSHFGFVSEICNIKQALLKNWTIIRREDQVLEKHVCELVLKKIPGFPCPKLPEVRPSYIDRAELQNVEVVLSPFRKEALEIYNDIKTNVLAQEMEVLKNWYQINEEVKSNSLFQIQKILHEESKLNWDCIHKVEEANKHQLELPREIVEGKCMKL